MTLMSINDKLNEHIKSNYERPNAQADAVKQHFSQENHKDFLKKIKTYEDFYASKSNDNYRVVVNKDKVFIDQIEIDVYEVQAGSIFPFNRMYRSAAEKKWPRESNIIVQFDDLVKDVSVEVNNVIDDLDEALKFVDFTLFEAD